MSEKHASQLVSFMEMVMICLILLLLMASVSGQSSSSHNDLPPSALSAFEEYQSLLLSDVLDASDMPSNMPSMVPDMLRRSTSSDAPSDIPSYVPSYTPSDTPSGVPSDAPSSIPSLRLSQQPSLFPSAKPTTLRPTTPPPTFPPTSSPSWQPSSRPSMAPSAPPSTMPTIACHDEASYQSPINNFTCSNFRGTDCTAWRFVGLNVDQMETLVDSCPIACAIDCGSLERFEVKVTFRIINVLKFLDAASAGTLGETSVEYLSNYVETLRPASKFFLYEAELTAQQIRAVDGSANRNLRRTQVEVPQYIDLIVTVAFRGFAIALGSAAVNSLIVQGIDSLGYSRAIQRSGDSTFLDIDVTSAVADDSGASQNSTKKKGEGDGPSPGGTAAAVIMSFSLVGIIVGVFIKKRRTQTKGGSGSIVKMQEESEAKIFTSPTGSPRSPPAGSVFFSEGNTAGVVAGILRIMSGSPRSNDSSTHSGQTSQQSSKESIPGAASGSTSSQSEEEHPYSGLIPPMIVIDNLEETSPSSRKGGAHNVFPSQRIHASSELVAALNGTSNAYDPSAFQGELFSQPMCAKSDSDRSRSLSPGPFHRLWNDSDAEDGSVGPDITSSNTKDELDAIIDHTDTVVNNGLRVTTEPRSASRCSNQDSSPRSPTSPSRGNGDASSPDRERSFSDASTVLHNHLGDHSGDPPATAEKLKEGGGFIQSFWNRTPSKAMTKVTSLTSLDGADSRHGSKCSSPSADIDEPVRHIFWAPRKGKLGLMIECKSSGGPVVVHVKDYSPLLGQVLRGDKIAKIDGVSTLHMNLSEVTNLLAGKTSYLRGNVIQFVVLRWPENNKEDDPFDNQSNRSFESMSQGGSFSDMFTPSETLPTK